MHIFAEMPELEGAQSAVKGEEAACCTAKEKIMDIGNFSLSLAVKDIAASRKFYEKLGFSVFGGEEEQGWLIMKNPSCAIGLFQGMFEKNTLTFNPGWDSEAQSLDDFTDIREIQKALKADGVEFALEADESTSGAASCMIFDPDGNPILFDQHV